VTRKRYYTAAITIIALLVLRSAVFVVDETRTAIVTQFGRPVRVIETAGLNWKLPQPIQSIRLFDKRLALGQYPLHALISIDPDLMKVNEIMEGVALACRTTAESSFGIEVVDLRMKRLAFPEQNKQSVFDRMRAERERTAKKYRSEGEEEAIKIRAEADKERQEILAAAYMEAEKVRGEGDAEAMRIYGDAYNTDPGFYEFVRTLESYRKFLDERTTIVLSSDSDLLKLLDKKGN
jgi:membrane protease subunit HflC